MRGWYGMVLMVAACVVIVAGRLAAFVVDVLGTVGL